METDKQLLIAFYGDDFTGSTDALEFLSRAGVKTVLFIEPPTKEQLEKYTGIEAIGVAGMTRAMDPVAMENELRPAFQALKSLSPRHVHYKVCSTFDSSPEIGSIGKAIDVGIETFDSEFVPLLVAAPVLGRHCAFGNLFAKMGIGSAGDIYRLDRHPSMSKHPTTPANESDLRLHLAKQTEKSVGLIDILQIEKPTDETLAKVKELKNKGENIVLFDSIYQEQLTTVGLLIEANLESGKPLLSVGSSGIEMALSAHWRSEGLISKTPSWKEVDDSGPLLVISGSCSPVTSKQISYALSKGFKDLALDTEQFASEGVSQEAIEKYAEQAIEYIKGGFDVLIHTSLGNEDIRVSKSDAIFKAKGIPKTETSAIYGTALGMIARAIAGKTKLRRIIVAGGDTSSHAARAMGVESVEMIAPLSPGAPLCKAHASTSAVNGLELNFKGGQVGKEDYFVVASGRSKYNQMPASTTSGVNNQ